MPDNPKLDMSDVAETYPLINLMHEQAINLLNVLKDTAGTVNTAVAAPVADLQRKLKAAAVKGAAKLDKAGNRLERTTGVLRPPVAAALPGITPQPGGPLSQCPDSPGNTAEQHRLWKLCHGDPGGPATPPPGGTVGLTPPGGLTPPPPGPVTDFPIGGGTGSLCNPTLYYYDLIAPCVPYPWDSCASPERAVLPGITHGPFATVNDRDAAVAKELTGCGGPALPGPQPGQCPPGMMPNPNPIPVPMATAGPGGSPCILWVVCQESNPPSYEAKSPAGMAYTLYECTTLAQWQSLQAGAISKDVPTNILQPVAWWADQATASDAVNTLLAGQAYMGPPMSDPNAVFAACNGPPNNPPLCVPINPPPPPPPPPECPPCPPCDNPPPPPPPPPPECCPPQQIVVPAPVVNLYPPTINVATGGATVSVDVSQSQYQEQTQRQQQQQKQDQSQKQTQAVIGSDGGGAVGPQYPVHWDQPGAFFFGTMDTTYRDQAMSFFNVLWWQGIFNVDHLFGMTAAMGWKVALDRMVNVAEPDTDEVFIS